MKTTRPWPSCTVTPKAEAALTGGHPWVYEDEITAAPDPMPENGSLVDVRSAKGRYLGTGFLSLHSKIRMRLVSRNANDKFDEAFWRRRIEYAWAYRKAVIEPEHWHCCRVIFGEADQFPGLTADRFGDVLVVQMHQLHKSYHMADRVIQDSDKDFFEKRYRQIRHFEEYLYENSFRVVKIFLHVSKAEQKERFLERIDTPEKNWKFSAADIAERARFDEYNDLYSQVITETASKHAPWYALPADQKWYTRYLVSEVVADALEQCAPAYPRVDAAARAEMQKARRQLLAED